jgi:uncharacterized protein
MTSFICDRCGKCCISLGQSIIIERQLNDQDYYCRSRIDNAIFLAHVDKKYEEEIAEEYAAGELAQSSTEKKPCHFLRKDPSGEGSCCAIYTTRPKVCQDFRCYHMLIRNRKGAVCGRVIGKNTVRTDDAALENLWSGQITSISCEDTAAWTTRVAAILEDHGYHAEIVV